MALSPHHKHTIAVIVDVVFDCLLVLLLFTVVVVVVVVVGFGMAVGSYNPDVGLAGVLPFIQLVLIVLGKIIILSFFLPEFSIYAWVLSSINSVVNSSTSCMVFDILMLLYTGHSSYRAIPPILLFYLVTSSGTLCLILLDHCPGAEAVIISSSFSSRAAPCMAHERAAVVVVLKKGIPPYSISQTIEFESDSTTSVPFESPMVCISEFRVKASTGAVWAWPWSWNHCYCSLFLYPASSASAIAMQQLLGKLWPVVVPQ
ncbi:hypothetical protein Tco_1570546 [Tanacetum coccineum]